MGAGLFDDPRVADLLGASLSRVMAGVFASVEIAEEEIARARDGAEWDSDDPLWQSFKLMRPTHDLMTTEFVYRAHCRELLERVRAGEDTRPGTDAEISLLISDGSQRTPLHGDVVALQMRIFARAYPEQAQEVFDDLSPYEHVHGQGADEWESKLRDKCRQGWRRLGADD